LSLLKCLFLKQYNKTKKQTKRKQNNRRNSLLFLKNYSQDEIKIKKTNRKKEKYTN